MTDSNGQVRKRHVVTDDTILAVPNPYRFAGHYLDAETGFYNMGAAARRRGLGLGGRTS